MSTAKVRIRHESLLWLAKVDEHIRMFDVRGVANLLHAASDALDGSVYARELADLQRRKLITIVRDGPNADLNELAGYSGAWSAQLTEKALCAFWPDRLEAA